MEEQPNKAPESTEVQVQATNTATDDAPPATNLPDDDAFLDAALGTTDSAPKNDGANKVESKPDAKAVDPGSKDAKDENEVNDPNVEKAYKAALRSGMSRNTADKMLKADPSAFVEWGVTLAKNQGKTDAEFQRIRKEAKERETAKEQPEKRGTTNDPAPDSDDDLDAIVQPLSESYGEDIKSPMKAALSKIREPLRKAVEAANREAREARMKAADAQEAMEAFIWRSRASSKDYPELVSEEQFSSVMEKAREIMDPSRHKSVAHLLEEAAAIALAKPKRELWQAKIATEHAARANAAPTLPNQRTPDIKRNLSIEDLDDIAADAALSGKNAVEAVLKARST